MAVIKPSVVARQVIDENQILTLYIDAVLNSSTPPENIYLFCKEHNIEEREFYSFFGSFDSVRQEIWNKFFNNALAAIEKEPEYLTYSNKNKLLTLYFTLFEILTLNRSYILFSLKGNHEGLKNLKDLKPFRNLFKSYIDHLVRANETVLTSHTKVNKITAPVFAEGAWVQFLLILKFWMEDNSRGFEKTDIVIEKSVNTVVDLLNTKPLENLIDLGKFLWKEAKMR